jgi:hypothetical protein
LVAATAATGLIFANSASASTHNMMLDNRHIPQGVSKVSICVGADYCGSGARCVTITPGQNQTDTGLSVKTDQMVTFRTLSSGSRKDWNCEGMDSKLAKYTGYAPKNISTSNWWVHLDKLGQTAE